MKANHKWFEADLVLGVRKLSLLFLALKLSQFPLFGGFFDILPLGFPDLYNFQDLADFFDFPDFLTCFTPSSPNLSISPSPLFLLEADLLPLFLLKTGLLLLFFSETGLLQLFLLEAGFSGDLVVFKQWDKWSPYLIEVLNELLIEVYKA